MRHFPGAAHAVLGAIVPEANVHKVNTNQRTDRYLLFRFLRPTARAGPRNRNVPICVVLVSQAGGGIENKVACRWTSEV